MKYSKKELQYMRDNIESMSYKEIGKKLNRSENAIYQAMIRLGIIKPKKHSKIILPDMDDITTAYIAGLFDGDGSIGLYSVKGQKNSLVNTIWISTVHKSFAEEISNITGLPFKKVNSSTSKSGNMFVIGTAMRITIHNFLKHIRPYLRLKGEQADIMIDFISNDILEKKQSGKDMVYKMKLLKKKS